jgi:ribonuclease P/MRP protein subunit POP8
MEMDLDHPPTTTTAPTPPAKLTKTLTLTTTTLRTPPFAYAHLTLTPDPQSPPPPTPSLQVDALQVRAYLTTALRQFLGTTGASIAIDILLIEGGSVWVRVPREDLAAFAAGVTAFAGTSSSSQGGGEGGEGRMLLRLGACGDWLGGLVGREGEGGLWRD